MTLMSLLSPLYALDLGTQTTRIYAADTDTLLRIPTSEARRSRQKQNSALVNQGRVTDQVRVGRFLREKLSNQYSVLGIAKPRVIAAVACCQTQVEKIALAESISLAGASSMRLVSMAVAAACGAGVDLGSDRATILLSCGESLSELSVVLSGSQIYSKELGFSMLSLCQYLETRLEKELGVTIYAQTLSKLIAEYSPLVEQKKDYRLTGKKLALGKVVETMIPSSLISNLTREYLSGEAAKIETGLRSLNPSLASDLIEQGMILYGGLASMKGLPLFLSGILSIPVSCVPEPENNVVKGLKELVSSISFDVLEDDPMHIEVLGC